MPERDDRQYGNVPQAWSGNTNVPVVFVAPPASEPSVTRGVTGLFVPIFLMLFIVAALYFFHAAWEAGQALQRQQAITRDALGVEEYERLIDQQNSTMCRGLVRLDQVAPDRVERPNLVAQVAVARAAFDNQCARNRSFGGRFQQQRGADACIRVTPAGRGAPQVVNPGPPVINETAQQARDRLCRLYGVAPAR